MVLYFNDIWNLIRWHLICLVFEVLHPSKKLWSVTYEVCSNMDESSLITFLTHMLRQNSIRFYKGLYVTFKLAPDRKKNTVNLSSYSPLNEGRSSILTNSMVRAYNSDIDEHIILRQTGGISWNFKEASPCSYKMFLWKLRKTDMFLLNYFESLSLKSLYVCKYMYIKKNHQLPVFSCTYL